ncbi:hypothetical protein MTO96_020991 [Rhipicephalus appendiculatus]
MDLSLASLPYFLPWTALKIVTTLSATLIGIVTILIAVVYYRWRRTHVHLKHLPGIEDDWPFIRNIITHWHMKSREKEHDLDYNVLFFEYLNAGSQRMKHLPYFRAYMGDVPYVVIHKAEAAEAVFGSPTMLQKSIEYTWLHPWLGTGLLTSTGAKWKSRRRMLTPAFHFRILEDFLPVMNEHSVVFNDLLKQHVGKPDGVDIVPSVARCTLDVICETAMGTCVNAQRCSESKYVRAVMRLGELWFSRATKPWTWHDFTYRFTADSVDFNQSVNTVHTFTRKVIKDRKKMLLEHQAASAQKDGANEDEYLNLSGCRRAFLDLLLFQHFKDPSFTEEDIREEVDTFTFEGHDTTAVGISWTLYLLGLHQDVQQKVYEELEEIFGDDRERDATMEDIRRMKRRKGSFRPCHSSDVSYKEDWTYDGYIIPKGTVCTVFIYVLHRDPKEFPKPEEYIPERFPTGKQRQKFASMEMKTLVSRVLRNYKLESMYHRDKVQAVAELVLRARNGLRIRLTPRE